MAATVNQSKETQKGYNAATFNDSDLNIDRS